MLIGVLQKACFNDLWVEWTPGFTFWIPLVIHYYLGRCCDFLRKQITIPNNSNYFPGEQGIKVFKVPLV